MDEGVCASDHELLHSLQSGIPLHARPFQLIGEQLGLNEEHVLERLNFFLKSGMARRFGAVFNSYSLGYSSTLCAVSVPPEDIDRVADVLSPHPGVTHCYERDGDPNLWFTMTANKEGIADELRLLGEKLDPYVIMDLPATRRFKIRAVFDTRRNRGNDNTMKSEHSIKPQCIAPLTEQEKAVVRGLQGSIPIAADLFDQPARVSEMDVESLIALLEKWQKAGALRRLGLIVRHRRLGYTANSMCVWRVPESKINEAGRVLAECPDISHCYERPSPPSFPFNLYAMVHADTIEGAGKKFRHISEMADLSNGKMLMSVREFKKSSPVFFCEKTDG